MKRRKMGLKEKREYKNMKTFPIPGDLEWRGTSRTNYSGLRLLEKNKYENQ